jgi:hypothetical protein
VLAQESVTVTTHPVVRTQRLVHLFEVLTRLVILSFDFDAAVVVQVIGVAVAANKQGHGNSIQTEGLSHHLPCLILIGESGVIRRIEAHFRPQLLQCGLMLRFFGRSFRHNGRGHESDQVTWISSPFHDLRQNDLIPFVRALCRIPSLTAAEAQLQRNF